ncbi:MAG TPA: hypothetical protein DIU15_05220, partial [Deltaproteobacteria bacterium]|nr:hypothetical protein [Deltaproteobacteria bacterium]HCP45418.1 hypothetical protein [Deltaproteobacteria bacterium]
FQPRLLKARDRALSDTVVAKLKGVRERHLTAQEEKRNQSIVGYTPTMDEQTVSDDPVQERADSVRSHRPPQPSRDIVWKALVIVGLAVALAALLWLLD